LPPPPCPLPAPIDRVDRPTDAAHCRRQPVLFLPSAGCGFPATAAAALDAVATRKVADIQLNRGVTSQSISDSHARGKSGWCNQKIKINNRSLGPDGSARTAQLVHTPAGFACPSLPEGLKQVGYW
jgi:hypothetical protein